MSIEALAAEAALDLIESSLTPEEFAEQHPATAATIGSVRWHLSQRKTNGLLQSGAVFELRGPSGARGRVRIVAARWALWKLTRGSSESTDPDGVVRAERERFKPKRQTA
jgi:hypothetical protein